MKITVPQNHALVQDMVAKMRDITTTSVEFHRVAGQLTWLVLGMASASLPQRVVTIQTPLESCEQKTIDMKNVVIVSILRAGIVMEDTLRAALPGAQIFHVGVQRDSKTKLPNAYFHRLGCDLGGKTALVVDPMLATGASLDYTLELLKGIGCVDVKVLTLIASPEGVNLLNSRHPNAEIYTAVLDRELDKNKYIRPGLGDAGDRLFNTTST